MDAPEQYGVLEFMKHGLFVSLIWLLFYELNPLHITFIYKYQGEGSVNKLGGDKPKLQAQSHSDSNWELCDGNYRRPEMTKFQIFPIFWA